MRIIISLLLGKGKYKIIRSEIYMNNDKIYKGHTDYKDLVQCEDS